MLGGAAAEAAGFPGKLVMHDFRRTAATRLDSAPAISRSVAMTILGHKTDILFRIYIQRHDERLIEAAKTLAALRQTARQRRKWKQNRSQTGSTKVQARCCCSGISKQGQ